MIHLVQSLAYVSSLSWYEWPANFWDPGRGCWAIKNDFDRPPRAWTLITYITNLIEILYREMDTVLAIQWLSWGQDFITGAKLAAYSYNEDFLQSILNV